MRSFNRKAVQNIDLAPPKKNENSNFTKTLENSLCGLFTKSPYLFCVFNNITAISCHGSLGQTCYISGAEGLTSLNLGGNAQAFCKTKTQQPEGRQKRFGAHTHDSICLIYLNAFLGFLKIKCSKLKLYR